MSTEEHEKPIVQMFLVITWKGLWLSGVNTHVSFSINTTLKTTGSLNGEVLLWLSYICCRVVCAPLISLPVFAHPLYETFCSVLSLGTWGWVLRSLLVGTFWAAHALHAEKSYIVQSSSDLCLYALTPQLLCVFIGRLWESHKARRCAQVYSK